VKEPPPIEIWQMIAFTGFIILSSLTSLALKLKLEKDLWIGAVRTFSQLFLMGFVLKYVFEHANVFLVTGLFIWMVFWASRIINKRVENKPFELQTPIFLTMVVTYMLISSITTGGLLQVDKWYEPAIFIPLAGMVIGNSMNAIALSLDRLFAELRDKRAEVEQMLIFGADSKEAMRPALQAAVRTGMIPSINSMMSVGLVFIPGMMTGQILGGQDPVDAAEYQIMIMLMISSSVALGCSFVTVLVARKCFTADHQLKV
jgi:putative ABC transport system permease protein